MTDLSLKVIAIIQARMGSTRLPGKSLMPILGKPILAHILDRLKKLPIEIVVATTREKEDLPILDLCKKLGIKTYAGSPDDVLNRYLFAARHHGADVIIRITGDNPLMDPKVVEKALKAFMADYPRYDYFSNTLNRTYPRGMDVEIFKRRALEQAHEEAFLSDEREHVTPYFYKHPELFALGEFFYERDESDHRWTVDTLEDFQLIQTMMETLYPLKRDFSLEDLLELSLSHPEWKQINAHIQQKKF